MPYCNDFLSIFLPLEVVSISSLILLIVGKQSGAIRSMVKYISFNAVGTVVVLYGMSAVYWISGVTDIIKIKSLISSSVFSSSLFTVIVLGVLVKFVSVPSLTAYQTVYSKLPYGSVSVFVVLIKSSYLVLVFNVVVKLFCLSSVSFFYIFYGAVLLTMLISGVAAIRTSSLINGLLYSSLQQGSFMLVSIVVSYKFLLSTTVFIFYFMVYIASIAVFLLVVGAGGLKKSMDVWFHIRKISAAALLLSISGIPPFVGFYTKVFLFSVLFSGVVGVLSAVVIVSSLISFYFYGRLLIYYMLEFRRSINTDPHLVYTGMAVKIMAWIFPSILVVCLSLVIGPIVAHIDATVKTLLSPVLRSTAFKFGFVTAGWSFLTAEVPNTHKFTSFGDLLFALPNLHWSSWGETGLFWYPGFNMRTRFHQPYPAPLLPVYDSRYFWLSEWLAYPWQYIPSKQGDVGPLVNLIYRPLAPQFRLAAFRHAIFNYFDPDMSRSWFIMWPALRVLGDIIPIPQFGYHLNFNGIDENFLKKCGSFTKAWNNAYGRGFLVRTIPSLDGQYL
jgi:NADH:ubiquinone oxidoreductase subunit 2 (subunit N)